MKRYLLALTFASAAIALPSIVGCSADTNDKLAGSFPSLGGSGGTGDYDSLAAGENTHEHPAEQPTGENVMTERAQVKALEQQVGTPEVVARLHGCTKITYGALGDMLRTRGVDINGQGVTAGGLYRSGASALGVANYAGRVPEALFASTSALAKQFDIYVAAAPQIATQAATSTACPGVVLVQNNLFTKDGISCLIGKPARDEHVALANNLVSQAADSATGQRIAIAALLEAAHTCE